MNRRTVAALSAAALTVAGVVLAAGIASAATAAPIVGQQSGRCVDVPNSSTANGTQVQLYDCSGQANQSWTATSGKQLQVYGTKCLDANNRGTTNGTAVIIWRQRRRHRQRHQAHPLGLQRRRQPAVEPAGHADQPDRPDDPATGGRRPV
ncbi:ricin-type beta-trefoil lectin domain protein [Dactylosporangium matsuzakiense]|uniref:Ricin B lectin domain-containing protein n=1 Tax=Dactylosporangium matsuzakiense TaxID=53360 RepID=A0A9W6NTV9_9ACTN|nr:hypothetical protein GCM10017581_105950 [Dactylosporangium matsuzakiense]